MFDRKHGDYPVTSERDSEIPRNVPHLDKAKQILSRRIGDLAANASLHAFQTHSFPLTQTTALEYDFVISIDQYETVALDSLGAQVDLFALADAEQRLFSDRYGRMSNQLADRLESSKNNERLGVVIWIKDTLLNSPRLRVNENADSTEVEEALHKHQKSTRMRLASVGFDEERQIRVLDADAKRDALFPAIMARLTPNQIRNLARLPNIDTIHLTDVELAPTMLYRKNTRYFEVVKKRTNSSLQFIKGQNAHITVLEAEGGNLGHRYDSQNCNTPSNLFTLKPCSEALWYPGGSTTTVSNIEQDPNGCGINDHATSVVGIISASPFNMEGFAPKAKVWVSGPCTGGINAYNVLTSKAAIAVTDKKTNIINLSFASTSTGNYLDAFDTYFDRLSYTYNTTVVVAAGNTSNATYVASPGKAHNVITVGAVDDKTTVNDTDAVMYSFSNGGDPITTVHKPEVVAPGGMYVPTRWKQSTCFYDPSIPVSDVGCLWYRWKVGTSYAAPVVSSIAALLMTRNAALKAYPEAVKAIIIASATERPTGDSGFYGMGGVFANYADDIAARNQLYGGWQYIDDFCSKYPAGTEYIIQLGSFPAGTDFHVAISRGVNPDDDSNYNKLAPKDFTLRVLASNGTISQLYQAGRRSWLGNFHVKNNATANIRIYLYNNTCTARNIPMGIAWRHWLP